MIKALLFDINGTVTDIFTAEDDINVYRTTANYLSFHGVFVEQWKLKELFFELNRSQRKTSPEEFPEFDVEKIFAVIIDRYAAAGKVPPPYLAAEAAKVFRSASRFKLEPYTGVTEILAYLQKRYLLGAVSDGQSLWAVPELQAAGLDRFFSTVVVSGDYGYRKPDRRLFETALAEMGVTPDEAIFIGNDMYRDVYGAGAAGMKTVFFQSNQGDHSRHGAEPDYIIYQFCQLPAAIDFLTAGSN
jgi:putative hydrolase of the HAD superfamily